MHVYVHTRILIFLGPLATNYIIKPYMNPKFLANVQLTLSILSYVVFVHYPIKGLHKYLNMFTNIHVLLWIYASGDK